MAVFTGTDGADVLSGGGLADFLEGLQGADTLLGGGGDDVIYGAQPTAAGADLIQAVRVASGLTAPLFAASAPGDPNRLFYLEKDTGRIGILNASGQLVGTFLDIPDAEFSRTGEQGVLGFAFHPDYAVNGRLYVNLTNAAGDTEIWEYTRSASNPDAADPTSKRLILTFDQPFQNHNGGWLGFGPDGLLYIASGDGGGAGDPQNNAQNPNNLLGKILRIDVNRDDFPTDATRNYGIPADNPFAGAQAGADEIWVMGLRNPWRPSFDSATGDFYIADVGQGAREEVNVIRSGQGPSLGRVLNFGWDYREGTLPFEGTAPAGLIDPVLEYSHTLGRSITGGYVYRGPGGTQGHYWFADFITGRVWTARIDAAGAATDFIERTPQIQVPLGTLNSIASFAVDGLGRLYAIGIDGEIFRLDPGLTSGDAGDLIFAGDGADTVLGDPGDDTVYGGEGADLIHGGQGADRLLGEAGADTMLGGAAADTLFEQDGDDQAFGDAGADLIYGGLGDDTAYGGADGDTLVGEGGADVLAGEDGADQLFGGADADQLYGGTANDTLYGGDGFDVLNGGDGADVLAGEAGGDLIVGGAGGDLLIGGAGGDRFLYLAASDSTNAAPDFVVDFTPGADVVDLSPVDANAALAGDQAFVLVAAFTGVAGQARLAFDAALNRSILLGDVNGDGVADLAIAIAGPVGAGDFVL